LVAGLYEACDRGGATVILTNRDDNVVEEPGFNVFAVMGGRVFTPESGVLEGITRKTFIELAAEKNILLDARAVPADEVRGADGAFLTSTTTPASPRPSPSNPRATG
jgi:branched-chain amino acid aminotransferase